MGKLWCCLPQSNTCNQPIQCKFCITNLVFYLVWYVSDTDSRDPQKWRAFSFWGDSYFIAPVYSITTLQVFAIESGFTHERLASTAFLEIIDSFNGTLNLCNLYAISGIIFLYCVNCLLIKWYKPISSFLQWYPTLFGNVCVFGRELLPFSNRWRCLKIRKLGRQMPSFYYIRVTGRFLLLRACMGYWLLLSTIPFQLITLSATIDHHSITSVCYKSHVSVWNSFSAKYFVGWPSP